MIDLKSFRENPSIYRNDMKKRFKDDKIIDVVLEMDSKWRELKFKADALRAERNKISEQINSEKKKEKQSDLFSSQVRKEEKRADLFSSQVRKEGKNVSSLIKKAKENLVLMEKTEKKEDEFYGKLKKELQKIPNLMHKSVPIGRNAEQNVEIRKWGKITKPKFEIINHAEILEKLNLADFDAGRRNSGQAFNYLLGEMAMLDYALQRYGLDFLVKKRFTPVIPPILLNFETLLSVLNGLEDFENVVYKIENEDLYLIGTAEHPLTSLFRNKTLNKKELPIKLCASTPCFRKEVGSHSLDTKGLFRMHQFNKVEQVVFCSEEVSYKILEEMQKITEDFFKSLEIPFRVIEICSGDLGSKFSKQYDIEAWFPRQKKYAEVTSAGNCTDFQARALNTKYIDGEDKKYVHILNNTMVATSRAMVVILENHQQKDSTIKIPKVLWKYMNGKKVIGGKINR